MAISPTVRQMLVVIAPLLAAFSAGGAVTFPGVLLQQLKSNESTIHLDFDTASWIGSIHGISGIPSILMPTIMHWRGRKFAFITACSIILIGWILACTATNATRLLISESFHGLGTNSLLAVSLLSLSEMVDPRYRNISLQMFGTVQSLGMALVGIMVRYVSWNIISQIMCVPVLLGLMAAFLWPESPSWLACKGKFDRCEKAFLRLRGTDELSKRELEDLINAQRDNLIKAGELDKSITKYVWDMIKRKDFYMPALHMLLLLNMMYWSGSAVVLIYCIDMIRKATQNEDAAFFGGIAINFILFAGVASTAILIKYFKNKTVLLCSTFGACISLACVNLISYLQSVRVLAEDSLLCLYMLIVFMIANCLGLNSLVFDIAAELMPVRHRSIGGGLYIIYNCALLTTSLKTSPYLIKFINLSGTFLIYTLNSFVCGLLVWRYVPETKRRTLQEIEDYYLFGNFDVKRNAENLVDEKPKKYCLNKEKTGDI